MDNNPVSFRPSPNLRQRIKNMADAEHRSFTGQVVHLLEIALAEKERIPAGTQSPDSVIAGSRGRAVRGAAATKRAGEN